MQWKKRWGYWMASTATRPGVYRLRDGGFFIRGRVTLKTGRRRAVAAVLHETKTVTAAQIALDELVADALAEAKGQAPSKMRWADFAVSRLEQRIRKGKMQSAATVELWKSVLPLFIDAWGHVDAREVSRAHIDHWLDTTVAKWMTTGKTSQRKRRIKGELTLVTVTTVIKPRTVNSWLRVLRAICHAARVGFGLDKSAFEGIEFFEEGRAYTREEPNALRPDMIPRFMQLAREMFPQHYAMILLGFVTGLRPSSIRPLRRRGPSADIDWTTGELLIRRSHSRKQHVMDQTKTKTDNELILPPAVLDVLRDHVAALEGKMAASDLLFPSERGELRARTVLQKPFAALRQAMGLSARLTPRAMRRTFNDACRAAGIHDVVTRSISGHQTEQMQRHYSTAAGQEQQGALAQVHRVVTGTTEGKADERV